jgi:hypothetical protein
MKPSKKKPVSELQAKPEISEATEKQPLTFKDFYPVTPPFGNVGIKVEPTTGRIVYFVIEPTMDQTEQETLMKLKAMLKEEVGVSLAVLKDENLTVQPESFEGLTGKIRLLRQKRFPRLRHNRRTHSRPEHRRHQLQWHWNSNLRVAQTLRIAPHKRCIQHKR